MKLVPTLPVKITDPGAIVGFVAFTVLSTLAVRWVLKKVGVKNPDLIP